MKSIVMPAQAGIQTTDRLGSRPSRFARQYIYGGKAAGRGNDDYGVVMA
jgi:hypothetical protein